MMKKMKWMVSRVPTKSELISGLTKQTELSEYYEEKTLIYHVSAHGGVTVLWSVMLFNVLKDYRNLLQTGKHYYIRCTSIENKNGEWHYAHQSEFAFPNYFDCPMEFLSLAKYEVNHEWREKVRHYHTQQ